MKKIALIVFLISFYSLKAQTTDNKPSRNYPQGFIGIVFAASGATTFSEGDKPFSLAYNVCPNLLLTTPKTYHNLMYGLGNNVVKLINGYWLTTGKNNKLATGLYLNLYKYLEKKQFYTGLGLEEKIRAECVNFFIFVEFGTTFEPFSKILTVGFHANIELPFRKQP